MEIRIEDIDDKYLWTTEIAYYVESDTHRNFFGISPKTFYDIMQDYVNDELAGIQIIFPKKNNNANNNNPILICIETSSYNELANRDLVITIHHNAKYKELSNSYELRCQPVILNEKIRLHKQITDLKIKNDLMTSECSSLKKTFSELLLDVKSGI